jgi:nucleotide-binding universal stress UspA family protein
MKKILVAADFSEGSIKAVGHALKLGAQFNAELLILHVLHDPTEAPGFYAAKKAGKKVWHNMEQMAAEMMDGFVKKHIGSYKKRSVYIIPGLPAVQIVRLAKKEKVDLIVMGSHGRSGWQRFVLGSVADRVLRDAPCPVLTVPESAKK